MYTVRFCRTGLKDNVYAYNRRGLGSFVRKFKSLSQLVGWLENANKKRWNICVVEIDPPLSKEASEIYRRKVDALRRR